MHRFTFASRLAAAPRQLGRALRTGVAVALLTVTVTGTVHAQSPLALADADALSGDVDRIRRAIDAYTRLDTRDPEVQWRLLRAYYNFQDELTEQDRDTDQQWACEAGHEWATKLRVEASDRAELVYYYGVVYGCYLRFHMATALRRTDDLLEILARARRLDPRVNEAGPDRALGVLYLQLPLWMKDRPRALRHLQAAVAIAPERGGNRAWLAKALVDNGRASEAQPHIDFVRAGNYTVSSPHWRAIYTRRIEQLAAEAAQSGNGEASR